MVTHLKASSTAALVAAHAVMATAVALDKIPPLFFWVAWVCSSVLVIGLMIAIGGLLHSQSSREQERTAAVIGALYMGAHYAEDIHRRAGGGSLFLTTEALNHLEDRGAIEVVDENGGDGRRGYYLVRGYVHTMPRGR